MHLRTAAGLIAIAVSLAACSNSKPAITAANARKAYHVGENLAAQDRASTQRRRAQMARLVRVRVLSAREMDRSVNLLVEIRNLTAKATRSVDMVLEIDEQSGQRLALAALHTAKPIAANGSLTVHLPVRFIRFGEDAARMSEARGVPKRYVLDVSDVTFADGSDAGYDD